MKRYSSFATATLVTILLLVTAGMAAGGMTSGQAMAQTGQNATDDGRNATVPAENVTDGGNLTVVNQGENVSLDDVEQVSVQDPTVYVGPNVTVGPNNTSVNVSQTFVLGGETSGWQGLAPASIDGTVNPTLNMTAGQVYDVTWVNFDGAPHNVVIADQQGNVVAETPVISGEGAAQSLLFEAPPDAGTYYCVVHPSSMRGQIVLEMNVTANGTTSTNATGA